MAIVKPFFCIRPAAGLAEQVASLPYDVYSRAEARKAAEKNPLSFLNIDRPETQFPEDTDMYGAEVYQKARELLEARIREGIFTEDKTEKFFIYELTMNGHSQTGITACCSVDDYISGVIKRHENTREEKEQDRICHVDVVGAHTGPIFLAYRPERELNRLVAQVKEETPLYDFAAEDGIVHRIWAIENPAIAEAVETLFQQIPALYIADGHHRAASAVKVGLKRRTENPFYTGKESFNYFLAVLFPADQLKILPYNRVVKDLNGLAPEEFFKEAEKSFEISRVSTESAAPEKKGEFGMFLDGCWYRLTARPEVRSEDPVAGLDVSILQDFLLGPVLGIGDPKTDKRIDFIGGIRGLAELERRAGSDMRVAFSMYPTSMEELLRVADAGQLMPPKSTWFEPKLRSGLFIHRLDR